MEDFEENQYYKPNYSTLFNKIKEINTPIKNEILMSCHFGYDDIIIEPLYSKQLSAEKNCQWKNDV
jgi:adenine specific DNA methylase Mod